MWLRLPSLVGSIAWYQLHREDWMTNTTTIQYHVVIGVSSFGGEISSTYRHTGVQGYGVLDLNLIEVYHGLQLSAITGVRITCSVSLDLE